MSLGYRMKSRTLAIDWQTKESKVFDFWPQMSAEEILAFPFGWYLSGKPKIYFIS
jgi:hypothetical protein